MPQENQTRVLSFEDWKPTTAGVLYRQGYLSSSGWSASGSPRSRLI